MEQVGICGDDHFPKPIIRKDGHPRFCCESQVSEDMGSVSQINSMTENTTSK